MDLTSVLKNELFRPLTTLIVPGAIGASPYVLILGHHVPAVPRFWDDHPNAFVAVLITAILALGLLLDNLGAALEYHGWDAILERQQPGHRFRWHEYLKLELGDEFVGQRYLRTTLMRMKFELTMPPALLLFAVGLIWLNAIFAFWSTRTCLIIVSLATSVAAVLVYESYRSAKILAETRIDLLVAKGRPLHATDTP